MFSFPSQMQFTVLNIATKQWGVEFYFPRYRPPQRRLSNGEIFEFLEKQISYLLIYIVPRAITQTESLLLYEYLRIEGSRKIGVSKEFSSIFQKKGEGEIFRGPKLNNYEKNTFFPRDLRTTGCIISCNCVYSYRDIKTAFAGVRLRGGGSHKPIFTGA